MYWTRFTSTGGRYGLAYSDGKYGFIDKNLNTKIDFQYAEALPFDDLGFAKVVDVEHTMFGTGSALHLNLMPNGKSYNLESGCPGSGFEETYKRTTYLIDTTGRRYKLAVNVEEMDSTTEAIDLRRRNLTALPKEVYRCTSLKMLLLSNNQIKELDSSIGTLTQLEHIDLYKNKLVSLPQTVGNWTRLQYINLEENNLQTLPPGIGQWKKLRAWRLRSNHLSSLPVEIGELDQFSTLDLHCNFLDTFPVNLTGMVNLKHLDMSYNRMKHIPEEIGKLPAIEELDLDHNYLRYIPASIGHVSTLRRLRMYGTIVDSLPPEMAQLKQLTLLTLPSAYTPEEKTAIQAMLPHCKILFGEREKPELGKLEEDDNEGGQ